MDFPTALKTLQVAYKAAADTEDLATPVTLPQDAAFVLVHWHMAVKRREQRQYATIARERKRADERAARKVARELAAVEAAAKQSGNPSTTTP